MKSYFETPPEGKETSVPDIRVPNHVLTPPSPGRQACSPPPSLVWAALHDLLPKNRVWEGKKETLHLSNQCSWYHSHQEIKVNIATVSHVDIIYAGYNVMLDTLPLWDSPPIHDPSLTWEKCQRNPSQE